MDTIIILVCLLLKKYNRVDFEDIRYSDIKKVIDLFTDKYNCRFFSNQDKTKYWLITENKQKIAKLLGTYNH